MDDLTWALHQVEAEIADPTSALHTFRVPADDPVIQVPENAGLLRPGPAPLDRRTEASDDPYAALLPGASSEAEGWLLAKVSTEARRKYVDADQRQPTALALPLPRKRKGRRWLIAVSAACLTAIAATVVVVVIAGDGERGASSQPAPVTTSTPPPATSGTTPSTTASPPTTARVTTTAAPTSTTEPIPTFGLPQTVGTLTLAARDAIDAFGFLCVIFDVSGSAPLVFLPEMTSAQIGDSIFSPSPEVQPGRAPGVVVYGEELPTSREVCWPAQDWQQHHVTITYAFDDDVYQWLLPAT